MKQLVVLFENVNFHNLSRALLAAQGSGISFNVLPGRSERESWAGVRFDFEDEFEALAFKLKHNI